MVKLRVDRVRTSRGIGQAKKSGGIARGMRSLLHAIQYASQVLYGVHFLGGHWLSEMLKEGQGRKKGRFNLFEYRTSGFCSSTTKQKSRLRDRTRKSRLQVAIDQLEPRVLFSDYQIGGAPIVDVGIPYTLTLTTDSTTLDSWTVDWGDGTTGSPDSQTVSASFSTVQHTYSSTYSYDITATVSDSGSSYSASDVPMQVVAPSQGANVTLLAGQNNHVALAYFGDLSTTDMPSDFTAVINWGDSNGSVTGSVVDSENPDYRFEVIGDHLYASEGSYTPSVTITDSSSSNTTVTASVAAQPALGMVGNITTVAATPYTLNLSAGASGSDTISSWTINWGDGEVDTYTGSPASEDHTFSTAGSYTVSATATDTFGTFSALNLAANASQPVFVSPAVNAVSAQFATGEQNQSVLAQINGLFGNLTPSNYSVSIDWGDGTSADTTTGYVRTSNTTGALELVGTHQYAAAPTTTPAITLTYTDGSNATVFSADLNISMYSASLIGINEYSVPPILGNSIGDSGSTLVLGSDGKIWYIDQQDDQIVRMNANTTTSTFSISTTASDAQGLTLGSDGNLWFVLPVEGQIGSVTPSGNMTLYTGGGTPIRPILGSDGNIWFIDTTNDEIGKITSNGTIQEFTLPSGANAPNSLTAGSGGQLWYTDSTDNVISSVTSNGTVSVYSIPTQVSGVSSAVLGSDGNIWFAETAANKIGSITSNGTFSEIAMPGGPTDFTVGTGNMIWFITPQIKSIGYIITDGSLDAGLFTLPSGAEYPDHLTADSANNIWYTDVSDNSVGEMTPSGGVSSYTIPSGNAGILGGLVDSGGNVWFAESNWSKLMKITPNQIVPIDATSNLTVSNVTVGSFNDMNSAANVSNYTATISWGDGNYTTNATLSVSTTSPYAFSVTGNHTYSTAGIYMPYISLISADGATAYIGNAQGSVSDPSLISSLVGTGGSTTPTPAQILQSALSAYQYVYNNIKFQPYADLLKGVAGTIATQAGNDWDQDALLITKLNAARITGAQYMYGNVTAKLTDVAAWLGVAPDLVDQTLVGAGMLKDLDPGTNISSSNLSIANVTFRHVWVQVTLPNLSGVGTQTLELDPSWKYESYNVPLFNAFLNVPYESVANSTANSTNTYLGALANDISDTANSTEILASQWYEDQVQSYLNSNYPGMSISQLSLTGTIIPTAAAALPSTLPFTPGSTIASIDASNLTQVRPYETIATVIMAMSTVQPIKLDCSFYLPEVGPSTFVVQYYRADNTGVNIQFFINDQLVSSTTPGVATYSASLTELPWTNGTTAPNIFINTTILSPLSSNPGSSITYTPFAVRTLGQTIGIGIDAGQWSDASIAALQFRLNSNVTRQPGFGQGDPAFWLTYQGEIVGYEAMKLYHDVDKQFTDLAGLAGLIPLHSEFGVGLMYSDPLSNPSSYSNWVAGATNALSMNLATDNPLFDFATEQQNDMSNSSIASVKNSFGALVGDTASVLEGWDVEQSVNAPAISTVVGLAIAVHYHTGILDLQPSQVAVASILELGSSQIGEITNELNAGYEVIVVDSNLTYGNANNWHGGVWIAIKGGVSDYYIMDDHGAAAHGGAQSSPIELTDQTNQLSYIAPPVKIGDPVNPYNGDLIHQETDFSIPTEGGPITFTRTYDSLLADTLPSSALLSTPTVDVGMGLGWTFTFSDYISVAGTTVDWITSGGEERRFTHTNSNFTHGTFSNSAGVFGTMTSTDINTFIYTETDGTVYDFVVGKSLSNTTISHLTSISDANGNSIQFFYDPSNSKLLTVKTKHGSSSSVSRLTFQWSTANPHITQITDSSSSREYQYDYTSQVYSVDPVLVGYNNGMFANGTVLSDVKLPTPSAPTTPSLRTSYFYYQGSTLYSGLLTSIVDDVIMATHQFVYDANRRVFSATDPLGNSEMYTYDLYHNMVYYSNENGNTTTYEFNKSGLVTETISSDLSRTVATWATTQPVITQPAITQPLVANYVDADGRTTISTYDLNNGEVKLQVKDGVTTSYTYGGPLTNQVISSVVTAGVSGTPGYVNQTTSYAYDNKGNLIASIDAMGHTTSMSYDTTGFGNMVTKTLPIGVNEAMISGTYLYPSASYVVSYSYDTTYGYVTQTSQAGITSQYQYDVDGNRTLMVDGNNNTTTYTYDVLNELTKEVISVPTRSSTALTTSFVYSDGDLTSKVDPLGETTIYQYDLNHRLIATTNVFTSGSNVTNFNNYDAAGNVTETIDGDGNPVFYTYDTKNRLISTLTAIGFTQILTYNGDGQIASVTTPAPNAATASGAQPNTERTSTTYDANGYVSKILTSSNLTVQGQFGTNIYTKAFTYDGVGNVLKSIDQNLNATVYTYDKLNRVSTESDGTGLSNSTYSYDADGNLVKRVDGNGNTSTFGYDPLNRKVSEADGSTLATTTYSYDNDNNLTSVIDPKHNTATFGYDALNAKISESDGTGLATTSYGYDANGNLIQVIDPNNNTTSYGYDQLNRKTKEIDGSGGSSAATTSIFYDSNSNVVETLDPRGTETLTNYDALNRETFTKTIEVAPAISCATVSGSNVTLTTSSANTYKVGDVLECSVAGTGAGVVTISSVNSTSHSFTFSNSTLSGTVTATYAVRRMSAQAFQYDSDNNLTASLVYQNLTLSTPLTATYGYDALNRKTLESEGNGAASTTYTYDADNNLTKLVDPKHNTATYGYDALNRKTSEADGSALATTTYTYDSDNNLVKLVDPNHNTTTFGYDALNRQISKADPANSATTTYTYDSDNNLTRVVDPRTITTSYSYDAMNRKISEIDGSGSAMTNYGYDANGNLIVVVDPRGTITLNTYDVLNRKTFAQTVEAPLTINSLSATGTTATMTTTTASSYKPGDVVEFRISPTVGGSFTILTVISSTQFTFAAGFTGTYTPTAVHVFKIMSADSFYYDASNNLTSETVSQNLQNNSTATTASYGYDALNRKTLESDGSGAATTTYLYDANNNLTQVITPNNHTTTYIYDALNRKTKEIDPTVSSGTPTTTYVYDLDNNLTKVIDPNGNTTGYFYDALNRRTTEISPSSVSSNTSYQYDADGNVTKMIDPNTHTTSYVYDAMNRKFKEIDGNGATTTTYLYDKDNNLTMVIDPKTNTTTYSYDLLNRKTSETDPAVTAGTPITTYSYDLVGNVTSIIDPKGNTTQYAYDALNRKTLEIDANPGGGEAQRSTTYLYDSNGNLTTLIDMSHTTSYSYDSMNRKTLEIDPNPGSGMTTPTTSFAYDNDGNLTRTIDTVLGLTTTYQYDAMDRKTAEIDPAPYSGSALPTTSYVYDSNGNLVKVIDPLSRTTTYGYDALNRKTSEIDPNPGSGAPTTSYHYDAAGNLVGFYTPVVDIAYSYDALNRTLTESIRSGVTSYTYDLDGNVTTMVDPNGNTTQYQYDAMNRQTKVIAPEVNSLYPTTSYGYDLNGNRTSMTDPNTAVTIYDFDGMNREIKETDPIPHTPLTAHPTTSYTYDAFGNQLTVGDADGNTTTNIYDGLNRLLTSATATGTRTYSYDVEGNLTHYVDRDNRTINYAYDKLNHLTTETWVGTSEVISTTYDLDGEVLTTGDSTSTTAYTYDALGEVTQEDSSRPGLPDVIVNNTYDSLQRSSLTLTLGSTFDLSNQYTHSAGLLIAITQNVTTTAPTYDSDKTIGLSYDNNTNLTEIDYSSSNYQPAAQSFRGYDALNHVTSINNQEADEDMSDYEYDTYDSAGRLTQQVEEKGVTTFNTPTSPATTSFIYDNDNQLISSTGGASPDAAYTYDLNGNRNDSGNTIGYDNEITFDGTYHYTYDSEGNMLTKSDLYGQTSNFSYDYRNRLTSLITNTGQTSVYTYDTENRRISQTFTDSGTVTLNAQYVYDGESGSGVNNLLAVMDGGTGAVTKRYLSGEKQDQVFAQDVIGAQNDHTGWLLSDHLGSVADVFVVENDDQLTYDAFGNVTSEANSVYSPPDFHFTGYQLDPSGLNFANARYYDPQQGRFITQDPTGFAAGDTNLYRYVGNHPTYGTDPTGLCSEGGVNTQFSNAGSVNLSSVTSQPTISFQTSPSLLNSNGWGASASSSFNGYATQSYSDVSNSSGSQASAINTSTSLTNSSMLQPISVPSSASWNMSSSLGISNSFDPLSPFLINGNSSDSSSTPPNSNTDAQQPQSFSTIGVAHDDNSWNFLPDSEKNVLLGTSPGTSATSASGEWTSLIGAQYASTTLDENQSIWSQIGGFIEDHNPFHNFSHNMDSGVVITQEKANATADYLDDQSLKANDPLIAMNVGFNGQVLRTAAGIIGGFGNLEAHPTQTYTNAVDNTATIMYRNQALSDPGSLNDWRALLDGGAHILGVLSGIEPILEGAKSIDNVTSRELGTMESWQRGLMGGSQLLMAGTLVGPYQGIIGRTGELVMTPGEQAFMDNLGDMISNFHANEFGGIGWGNSGKPLQVGQAGSFAELDNLSVVGDNITPHHMPQAALGFTSYGEGGALALPQSEHLLTRTYGFSGARLATEEAGVPFRTVLARDINDIRNIAGSTYNNGIQDLLEYYRQNFPKLMLK